MNALKKLLITFVGLLDIALYPARRSDTKRNRRGGDRGTASVVERNHFAMGSIVFWGRTRGAYGNRNTNLARC